jgi:hypothetical protein
MSNDAYFPLKVGNTWTYEAATPIGKNVRTLKIDGPAPVGPHRGVAVTSEAGETDLAWAGGTLVASKLSGVGFNPPLPLLKESGGKGDWSWQGKVRTPTGLFDARATASSTAEDRLVVGRKAKTTRVEMHIDFPGQKMEVVSWYERGVGLVGQEQRNGGALVTKLVYVSGP